MKNEDYSRLVRRLEAMANTSPGRYTAYVMAIALLGFAILGVAVGLALFSVLLLVGMVALVVATGGKALLFFAKLAKLILLLVLPAWAMIKSSFTLLLSRFPRPEGRELKPAEAPALFARLKDIQARMRGPRIHKVLVTDELNAAIVQHPRLGLLGWEENYLILGLPLLRTLREEEALAVVAHEYGHLSGHHSRFGGFIYRFRITWGKLQSLSEQWDDWGSRLIRRLFQWYAPYFNAYTFVLARQNEYVADRCSVETSGQLNAAAALMRVNVAALFEEETFWPSVNRRIAKEAEPLQDRTAYWTELAQEKLTREVSVRYLETARQRQTDDFDTHPALADRLSAMGAEAPDAGSLAIVPLDASAAHAWLGSSYPSLQEEFDRAWTDRVSEQWRSRHDYLKEQDERLASLEAQVSLAVEEQWERIKLIDELRPESDLLPLIDALLAEAPQHVSARYRRGILLLDGGEEAGIADLEEVMAADPGATLAACEAAWRFYLSRSPKKAEEYRARWLARSDYEARVEQELKTLPPDARIAPASLAPETLDAFRAILREHGEHVTRAYLFERVLKSDSTVKDYVLGFETSWLSLGDKGPEVIKRMGEGDYPFPVFIVHLKTRPYSKFRKQIKKLGIQPFYEK